VVHCTWIGRQLIASRISLIWVKHIILIGPPGTGKTTIAENVSEMASEIGFVDGYILTTATADWSTFDTIGGYMPNIHNVLQFQEGVVLRSVRENKW
jgi:MoxR-like ATPase